MGDEVLKVFAIDGNTISVGITRKAGDGAVTGSGSIAVMKFYGEFPGTSPLNIIESSVKMTDRFGADLVSSEYIRFNNGNVIVQ